MRNPNIMVPAIGVILAAVLGTVLPQILGDGQENIKPKVTSILPSEASVGTELDIQGERLDLVREVLLTKGGAPPARLAILQTREGLLTVVVPASVRPGEYNLEFQTHDGKLVSTGRTVKVTASP